MVFNADQFLKEITWKRFDELKKPKLIVLGQYLGLNVEQAMRRQLIKKLLIDLLVQEDIFEEVHLERKVDVDDDSDRAVKLKQLEIQKEIKLVKLQLEKALQMKETE